MEDLTAAPDERREVMTGRERAVVLLAVGGAAVLTHAVLVALLLVTGATGSELVLLLTAVPWAVTAAWAGSAVLRGGGLGPVTATSLLTAGAAAVAVDGALTGSLGQDLFCAVALAGVALALGAVGVPGTVLAAGPVVLGCQAALVLTTHGTSAAGWFAAVATVAVSAAVLVVSTWLHAQSRAALAVLSTAAVTDPLTGLLNRRGTVERFGPLRAAAPDGQRVAVIALDLDHFKAVNDQRGHDAGDRVLSAVADLLRTQAREGDLLVRLGGEELAWLGTWDGPEQAVRAAERLRRALAATQVLPGLTVTLSAGVAVAGDATGELPDGEALSRLLVAADRALYLAKAGGRDRVELAPESRTPPWPSPRPSPRPRSGVEPPRSGDAGERAAAPPRGRILS